MSIPTVEDLTNALDAFGETSASFGNYTINIEQDTDIESPRAWDNNGIMACVHSRYDLGDEYGLSDLQSALTTIVEAAGHAKYPDSDFLMEIEQFPCQHCNLDDDVYAEGCDHCISGYVDNKYYVSPHDSTQAQVNTMLGFNDIGRENLIILLPLYLYDHSGLTMSCSPFSCSWDSGQVGWIFTTPSKLKDGGHNDDDFSDVNRRLEIKQWLIGEVKVYDDYLTGNCFGYTLSRNEDESLDSCWGYFGDHKDSGILEAAQTALECRLKADEREANVERQSYLCRLKALIRHHVPLGQRMLVVQDLKPEGL